MVKSTSIDPSVVGADGVFRIEGPARVFVRESDAMAAIKRGTIQAGDVIVLCGCGPAGTFSSTYRLWGVPGGIPPSDSRGFIALASFLP